MAVSEFRRYYARSEFVGFDAATPGATLNVEQFETFIRALAFTNPVIDAYETESGLIAVQWSAPPTSGDLTLADQAVAGFVANPVGSLPYQVDSFAAETTTSAARVVKATITTQPLTGGRWRFSWNSSIRMSTAAANAGVQASVVVSLSSGESASQNDAWDLNVNHAYNGSYGFNVSEGQTVTASIGYLRLGAAGVAEMSGVRLTLDKVG